MNLTPEQRTAIYTLAATTAPILVALGVLTDTAVPLVLAQVESILAAIVAFAHRPTKDA